MKTFLVLMGVLTVTNLCFAADAAKGKALYDQRCSICHGELGKGDGAGAAAFPADQKPRDFSDAKFKFATDDAKFKELLVKGGSAVGLSPLMPGQPDLKDDDHNNIIAYVHTLKKK